MAVVIFDIEQFRAGYPQFTEITDQQLLAFADIAYLLVDNTENSRISETRRKILIDLMVCHLATLAQREAEDPDGGQLQSAKEGSVSSTYYRYQSTQDSEWYKQTACGRTYWELMAPFRTGGKYFAHKRVCPFQYW